MFNRHSLLVSQRQESMINGRVEGRVRGGEEGGREIALFIRWFNG